MDWDLAIEKNLDALKRIFAMLTCLVGTDAAGISGSGIRPTKLPRQLHRFVLGLLRPAESATRRLIIIAARGLVVTVRPWRARKPKPLPEVIYVLDRVDGRMVSVPMVLPQTPDPPAQPRRPSLLLPLLDPLPRFGARKSCSRASAQPHIWSFGDPSVSQQPHLPDPPPRSPDDPLDAANLARRLEAIGRALDDLPGQAKRLARWQARRDARTARERSQSPDQTAARRDTKRRFYRLSPMRPGRPPGWRRKPNNDVCQVLNELHGLAVWARDGP